MNKIQYFYIIIVLIALLMNIVGFCGTKEKRKIKKGKSYIENFQNHREIDIINPDYPKIYNNDIDLDYLSELVQYKKIKDIYLYISHNHYTFSIEIKIDENLTREWDINKSNKKEFIKEVNKILKLIEDIVNEDK